MCCKNAKNAVIILSKESEQKCRAVVVEQSNALVYLMISSLELKVEGSNRLPPFFFEQSKLRKNRSTFGMMSCKKPAHYVIGY